MSLFNSRHYRVVAMAVKMGRIPEAPHLIKAYNLIKLLSYYFKLDNPRFNEETFQKACDEKKEESK